MSLNLESIDNSKLVFIRSKETLQLTQNFNSNMRIDLQTQIETTNSLQDLHLQLSSCEIPVSFYNFSSNLKNINLKVNGANSLVLTSQHYDIDELCDFITADNTFKFSCEFKPQQNKVILTNTDSTSYVINFSDSSSQGLAKALGFKPIDITTGAGASYISDNSINLNTIHSIFLHSNLAISNVLTSTQGNFRNIIQKIPVNSEFGNMINYNPYLNSTFSTLLTNQSINSFEISLRDQNDILIDFNNTNFELSFLFEIHNKNIGNNDNGGGRRDDGGGRRSDNLNEPIINPVINPINNPVINPSNNNSSNNNNNQTLLPTQFAYTSQTDQNINQNNTISIPTEDMTLNDIQSNDLQNRLLQIELMEELL